MLMNGNGNGNGNGSGNDNVDDMNEVEVLELFWTTLPCLASLAAQSYWPRNQAKSAVEMNPQ